MAEILGGRRDQSSSVRPSELSSLGAWENWPLFIAKEDFTEKTSGIWGSQKKQTAKNLLKKKKLILGNVGLLTVLLPSACTYSAP